MDRGFDSTPRTFKVSTQLPWGSESWTVAKVIEWCQENGHDPEGVIVSGGHLSYQRTETQVEAEARVERARKSSQRHREWLRSRYHAMFGDAGTERCAVVVNGEPCRQPYMHVGPCDGE